MQSDWAGLEQLTQQMTYWIEVHEYLISHTQTGCSDKPGYGLPYLDGDRMVIPDFPGNGPSSSDAWSWSSIVHERDRYTLVSSGFDRGDRYTDLPALSSTRFDYTAKFFLLAYVGESIRMATSIRVKPGAVSVRFLNRGVAEGWEAVPAEDSERLPGLGTVFRQIKDPTNSLYLAAAHEPQPTFYLDKSWYEISRMCAEGIPGIDHIPIPGDPGLGK